MYTCETIALCICLFVCLFADNKEVAIDCPPHNGIVGKPLQLTCTVTCNKCNSALDYEWRKVNDSDISCIDGQKRNITRGKTHIFQCIIPSASEKHNGTFRFWVQMSSGTRDKTFSMTIGTFSLFLNKIYTFSV